MPDPIVNIADTIQDARVIPISELRDGDEVFDVFGHSLGPVRLVKSMATGKIRYEVRSDPNFRYLVPWRGGGTITVRQARPDTTGHASQAEHFVVPGRVPRANEHPPAAGPEAGLAVSL